MKRFASLLLTFVMCISLLASLSTTASAGLLDQTASGQMQDTSSEENGTVYWELSYNSLKSDATLKLSGDGYMPNGTDQSWKTALGSRKITELIIEDGVRSIMDGAFYGEQYLESVTLPDSIEFIGEAAFADTGITSVTIPQNLYGIDGTHFNSQGLMEYKVHPDNPYYTAVDGVLYSKDMTELVAFPVGRYSDGGANDFVIPESVNKIGNSAFLNCKHKSVTIPETVKAIGMQSFAGNTALSTLNIINGVESIYDGAFLACNSLKTIYLPTSVKYIGYCSFGFVYDFDFDGVGFMLDQLGVEHKPITAENAEYYITLYTPYTVNDFVYCRVNEKVKIYTPTNSAGHKYCKLFGVDYRLSEAIIPKPVSAKQTASGVEIQWTYSSDATGYYVYRKNKSGDYEKIATVKGKSKLTYTDTKAYSSYKNTYIIKAYNSNGVSRYFTDGVSTYYIATPKLSSASNAYGGIKVSWKKVPSATNYNIYRRQKGESYWESLGTVKGSVTSCLDKDVSSKKTYYYTVRAYDKKGVSEYDTIGVGATYVPAPKVSSFKNTSKGVQISWKKVSAASSYRVYRKAENGKWELVKKLNNSTFTFTDTNVKSGVKYSYAVKAVSSGKISGYSTKTIEYLKKPVIRSAKSTKSGVTINYSKAAGADKYRIYRKLEGEDKWTRIATVKGVSTTTYTDTTAKKGETYRYTVRAFSDSYKSAYDTKGYKIKDKY